LVEELSYGSNRHAKVSWAYINFLQTNRCIFVPGLGIEEDGMALEQIRKNYPDHNVFLVDDCLPLVRDGGALNCVTWNILADVQQNPSEA
jgi:agmatine/peptidylarginine deiminase